MFWLGLAIVALLGSVFLSGRGQRIATLVFYEALIAWLLSQGGLRIFQGGEPGLLGWFVLALVFSLIGEGLRSALGVKDWLWLTTPAAAISYGLGLDVLRPDPYSYLTAAIVGAMVLLVAGRAYLRLAAGRKKNAAASLKPALALCVFSLAFVLYAGFFKVIDRGWLLPQAYAAAAGGLLFVLGNLWASWERLLGKRPVAAWLQVAAVRLGELLMVVAAFFVYRQFL
jgi:hypothetical protein